MHRRVTLFIGALFAGEVDYSKLVDTRFLRGDLKAIK